jgi:hypothetical protein
MAISRQRRTWHLVPDSRCLKNYFAYRSKNPVVIEKCLGHKMPKSMATYNKNEMLPQRKEALGRWSQHLEFLSQDNIVPILLNKC